MKRILFLLIYSMQFFLFGHNTFLSPKSKLSEIRVYSIKFAGGYEAVVEESPWFYSLTQMKVSIKTPLGTDLNSRIILWICPKTELIYIHNFYPDFIDSSVSGKGRMLLKELLLNPRFHSYEVLSKASLPFMKSLNSIPEMSFRISLKNNAFDNAGFRENFLPWLQRKQKEYQKKYVRLGFSEEEIEVRDFFWSETTVHGRIDMLLDHHQLDNAVMLNFDLASVSV